MAILDCTKKNIYHFPSPKALIFFSNKKSSTKQIVPIFVPNGSQTFLSIPNKKMGPFTDLDQGSVVPVAGFATWNRSKTPQREPTLPSEMDEIFLKEENGKAFL